MNRLTLCFVNKALEESYQYAFNDTFREQIYSVIQHYFLVLAGYLIASVYNKDYIITSIAISLMVTYCIVIFNWQRIKTGHIIICYNIIIGTGPEVILALIYITQDNTLIAPNLILSLLAFPTVFIKSNNIIIATLQILHYYIMGVFFILYFIGFSLYIMAWFPLCVLWIHSYYIKIKNNRELFQKSQINDSIYELIKHTTKEEFIIFNFNEERSKYEPECTNLQNLNLPQYLMGFRILNKAINLSSYLFNKYVQKNQETDTSEVIIGYQKDYSKSIQKIQLYVQTYPKLKFALKVPHQKIQMKQLLLKEHHLTDRYFKLISKTFERSPNYQAQILLNQLKLQIGLRRFHCILNSYVFQKQQINLNSILYNIARDLKFKVSIMGQGFINNDLGLFLNILMAIYVIIQKYNKEARITIEQQELGILLKFNFDKPIRGLQNIRKSNTMLYINDLYSILSNGQLLFDKRDIQALIIHNPDIPFK